MISDKLYCVVRRGGRQGIAPEELGEEGCRKAEGQAASFSRLYERVDAGTGAVTVCFDMARGRVLDAGQLFPSILFLFLLLFLSFSFSLSLLSFSLSFFFLFFPSFPLSCAALDPKQALVGMGTCHCPGPPGPYTWTERQKGIVSAGVGSDGRKGKEGRDSSDCDACHGSFFTYCVGSARRPGRAKGRGCVPFYVPFPFFFLFVLVSLCLTVPWRLP